MFRKLLQRLSGTAPVDPALIEWRARADVLAREGTVAAIEDFLARIDPRLMDEDTELDRERLDGRLQVLALEARLSGGDVPVVETQHKAIAGEVCRFLAPAALVAAEGDQPGKLFVTDTALRFAGGQTLTLKWSSLHQVATADRDLLVATRGGNEPRRFRCNSFGDALVSARLIEHLRRGRQAG